MAQQWLVTLARLALMLAVAGCMSSRPPFPASGDFKPAQKLEAIQYAPPAELARFEQDVEEVYRIGDGDRLQLTVWGRNELSGNYTVGPDGRISVPLAGTIKLSSQTREEAASQISQHLRPFYQHPAITLGVQEYKANRVTLLGRVQNPGVLTFDSKPTLIEALARAGALPVLDKKATLTRCAIIRGRDRIMWVDLKSLLNKGDLRYNIALKPNDTIYIPDSDDTLVYVMGAVKNPGAFRLTPDMSLMDALAQAGGPSEDAAEDEIAVYRPARGAVHDAPFNTLLSARSNSNITMEEGDVIYVPRSGLARFGYVMRQISPSLSFFIFGQSLAKP